MRAIPFYIVDVFAANHYQGNQLAVFVDLENQVSAEQMQQIAREINFAETTFIKANRGNGRFVVRIFTPEHEVPFAGHPSIGTSYIIAKFLLPHATDKLVLELAHCDIDITILRPKALMAVCCLCGRHSPNSGNHLHMKKSLMNLVSALMK